MNNYFHTTLFFFFGFVSSSLFQISVASIVSTGDFNKDFFVTWSPNHVNTSDDGKTRSLKLDQESVMVFVMLQTFILQKNTTPAVEIAMVTLYCRDFEIRNIVAVNTPGFKLWPETARAGFASNQMFLFGQIDMQIKLVPGDSAGTVLAFYLTSDQPNRDEIDLEFLGNVSGQPYILQTNIYADGFDNREERIHLWFDPSKDFHTYSVLWNLHQIVFMVDTIPIRVYKNHADKGVAFPRRQPMSLKATLWNGDSWATRGGQDKIDWKNEPFIASFKNYKIEACVWKGNPRFCRTSSSNNWWNQYNFSSLTSIQRRWFKWVRKYHMIYDYCQDNERFQNNLPRECSLPKY